MLPSYLPSFRYVCAMAMSVWLRENDLKGSAVGFRPADPPLYDRLL